MSSTTRWKRSLNCCSIDNSRKLPSTSRLAKTLATSASSAGGVIVVTWTPMSGASRLGSEKSSSPLLAFSAPRMSRFANLGRFALRCEEVTR